MRTFNKGVIVGEREPAQTLDEIIKWAQDEIALARQKQRKEGQLTSRASLSGRISTLQEVLFRLENLEPAAASEDTPAI